MAVLSFLPLSFVFASIAVAVASGSNFSIQPHHECIPNSASSIIQCPDKDEQPAVYCGSTRRGAVFWASSSAPIAAAANSVLTKRDLRDVRDVYATIEYVASEARRSRGALYLKRNCSNFFQQQDEWQRGSDEAHYVTNEQRTWVTSVFAFTNRMGLAYPNSHCFSEFKAAVDDKLSVSMFETLARFSGVLEKTGHELYRRVRRKRQTFFEKLVACWPKLYSNMDSRTQTNLFNCRVLTAAGIRRKSGQFSIPITYTNDRHDASPPEYMRLDVGEEWSLSPAGRIRVLKEPTFRRGNSSYTIRDTTTTLSTWGGTREMGHFFRVNTRKGPAMRHVLQKSNKVVQNVQDSIAISNVAILILPAVLTLLPISFMEYVSTRALLVNIVFTDIIPVLPLAVKGIELIDSGRKFHTGCTAYTIGTENRASELAVVEIWCAKCAMYPKIMKKGVAFLASAIAVMILGIWIELTAYRLLRRRIEHLDIIQAKQQPVWWQRPAMRQYVRKRQPTCSECTYQDSLSVSIASWRSESEPNSKESWGRYPTT